jgi:hypothetical protein
MVPGVSDQTIRRRPVRRFPYHVVYIELADRLQILAIAHDRRRPGYWVGRLRPSFPPRRLRIGRSAADQTLNWNGLLDASCSVLLGRGPRGLVNMVCFEQVVCVPRDHLLAVRIGVIRGMSPKGQERRNSKDDGQGEGSNRGPAVTGLPQHMKVRAPDQPHERDCADDDPKEVESSASYEHESPEDNFAAECGSEPFRSKATKIDRNALCHVRCSALLGGGLDSAREQEPCRL